MSPVRHPHRWLLLLLVGAVFLAAAACSRPAASTQKPSLERIPTIGDLSFMAMRPMPPVPDPKSTAGWELDLRHMDLREKDLSAYREALPAKVDFDTATRWPERLPEGFDPQRFLALGKDPGLGVRKLHERGITGKAIHVAVVDQTLMVDHEQYKDRIVKYRELGFNGPNASMHGPAVTSLLAGKEIGVAPGVRITYYAAQAGLMENGQFTNKRTFRYIAQAVNEILDGNAKLPKQDKVKVIGMSIGWGPQEDGYAEIQKAVERATREGVFVISTSLEQTHSFKFHGLGRDPLGDPNDLKSYRAGTWWRSVNDGAGRLLVPMDSRTTAGMGGTSEYAFYRQGGWSWCVPYLEGLYAMALQVKPDVTPQQFWDAAVATAQSVDVNDGGAAYNLGTIVNPEGLINRLSGK